MDYEHMKRCLTSLVIKEMKIKITMRYHITPIRIAVIKTKHRNILVRAWRNWKLCAWLVRM